MEKIMFIDRDYVSSINLTLKEGWKVKTIVPVMEPVSAGSSYHQSGTYGAYVVLEKEDV